MSSYNQSYYQKNKERLNEASRARYQRNRDVVLANRKARYHSDPEFRAKVRSEALQYYYDNIEKITEANQTHEAIIARRAYYRGYWAKNSKRLLAARKVANS